MLMWDASALAKRYIPEAGSNIVDAAFEGVDPGSNVTTVWGYAESYSILLRRRNAKVISEQLYQTATSALRLETIGSNDTILLTIDDSCVLDGVDIMRRHNLNCTDAALLACFLRFSRTIGLPDCVLVAADKRLARSGQAEGLRVMDVESATLTDVRALL